MTPMFQNAEGVTFDPVSHQYFHGGVRLPSVTQILKPLSDFDGIPPSVLDAKRDLGKRVHLAIQFHNEGDLDPNSIEPDVAPYLQAWLDFVADTQCEVLASELIVRHKFYGYCGTVDLIIRSGSRLFLVDIKTSVSLPISVGPQTAAYKAALVNGSRDALSSMTRHALTLRPNGTYKLVPLQSTRDWTCFMNAIGVYSFIRSTHGN